MAKLKDLQVVKKEVRLKLVGLDGNAYSLMGAFQRQARREGWTPEEIQTVLDQCTSGDYNNLVKGKPHCSCGIKERHYHCTKCGNVYAIVR